MKMRCFYRRFSRLINMRLKYKITIASKWNKTIRIIPIDKRRRTLFNASRKVFFFFCQFVLIVAVCCCCCLNWKSVEAAITRFAAFCFCFCKLWSTSTGSMRTHHYELSGQSPAIVHAVCFFHGIICIIDIGTPLNSDDWEICVAWSVKAVFIFLIETSYANAHSVLWTLNLYNVHSLAPTTWFFKFPEFRSFSIIMKQSKCLVRNTALHSEVESCKLEIIDFFKLAQ